MNFIFLRSILASQDALTGQAMNVHLHLGAHKTASTHMQATLRKNRDRLTAAGVSLISPDEVRALAGGGQEAAARMRPLPSLRAGAAAQRLRARLDERAGGGPVVAADENSLGRCAEVIARRALYPTAAARLAVWRPALAAEATVFLAIRSYADFFAGAHAQAARGGAAAALSPYALAALAALPRRWTDVVADIRSVAPRAHLVIWAYEDYPALDRSLMTRLTGLSGLDAVNRRPMATPRAPAMEAIFARAATRPGQEISAQAFDELAAAAPKDAPRYDPFSPTARKAMEAAYAEDLDRLRADPGVETLSA
ncbi:MAG: hypothetical protein AAF360_13155 [Pseudomonadota bacterium]